MDLETKKRELAAIIEYRTKGAILRSKSQWYNTPIANMATIAPKRGFSVVTVAKAAQLCVFFAKASRFINVLEIFTASTRKENPILKEIFEEILPSYI